MDNVLSVSKPDRQDWIPSLMVGIFAVLFCPVVNRAMGGLPVFSKSVWLGLAVVGTLSLVRAAFGARKADKRDKLICGAWVVFGTLFAIFDFVVAAKAPASVQHFD